ncbi:hypothetical protein [Halobaculum rubrum]|uniref:hypothetical protein n=1 Tax=Halobaculum rubrum TaxID=2872158 RepID=UPI001CA3C2F8|nr:hypothetical protein [Halobaculum rubrum]QZX99674.1 hypothetical protein K6T25_00760 [Halobaculum rubrum]
MPSIPGSDADPTITWDLSAGEDRVTGGLAVAALGLIAGVLVGPLLGSVVTVAGAAIGGDMVLLVVAAAAVIVAIAVNRALFAAIRALPDTGVGSRFGRGGVAVALIWGGLLHVSGVLVLDGLWFSGVLVAVGLALLVVVAIVSGRGTVDPSTGTIKYVGSELPLGSIRSIRSIEIGDRVVVFVRYYAGHAGAHRLPTFSRDAFVAAEPLLAPSTPPTGGDRDGAPAAVKAAAATMCAGSLVLTGGVYVIAPPDARPLVVMLALLTLPATVVLGWYAYAG